MDIAAALEAIHFGDVIEPYAVRIAVDEEHRSLSRFEFICTKVVGPQGRRFDVVKEIGESVGVRIEFFPLDLGGGSFYHFHVEIRPKVVRFLDPSIAAQWG